MSSEVLEPPPTEIISAKSEDKLEIEKEEQENKEEKKEEDTKEENKDEETKKEGDADKKDETESKPAEDATTSEKSAADGDKSEEKGADEPAESAEKADGADGEKKKGFSLPKVNIKTPKVIKDIRAKSKERKKKKDQEGEKSDEPEKAAEGTTDEAAKTEEGEEKKEGEEAATTEGEATAEATEAVTSPSAKDKVKEAFDNIKLPKMHRPAFLKKNKEEKTEKTEEGEEKKDDAKDGEETAKDGETADDTDAKTAKKEDGDNKEESEKADNETEKKDDTAEGEKSAKEGDEKSADAEKSDLKSAASMDKLKDTVEETKNSLACTLKGLKTRFKGLKGGKAKEGEGAEEGGEEGKEGEAADEKEKLLDNPENKDDVDADETEGAVKEVKEKKHVRALRTIRHAASGVPLMFKDIEMTQEEDIELGEDLLDKGGENKEGDQSKEALQEINLEDTKDEKESDEKKDTKSVTSEKKDPEKGEKEEGGDGDKEKDPELGGEEPAPKRRFKKNKCHVFHQRFKNLDDQQKMGVIGMLVGVFLFFIIILAIISAAAHPSGWSDHHRYVEGGNYISTNTGCGELWGHVDGDHMFSFRGIPYSIQVGRFEKSEGLTKLDDCGDEIKKTANETVFCARRNAKEEIIGIEDCLLLDIYTPTVMYDAQKPVIVYIPGDDLENLPTSQLANEMGVVYVVVHVRQGVLGFLSHSALSEDAYPKTSGNYALGDLITALQWINTNIAHFGGNKEAVTVLGHRQGASLATVLTGVRSADGLYHRVWATGGAGRFSNHSTDDSTDLWTQLVQDTCPGIQGGSAVKDCLLDTDVDTLLRAVDSNWEVWSPAFGQVPKAGAEEPQGLLTVDTVLLDKSLQATWEADGVAVPLVLGSDQQGEAQADSHQYLEWENNDVYREHIEGNLGSWNIELPGMVLERYNTSDNWVDYMSIVSDIRTVCPMANLATSLSVPMYVVTSPRDNGDLGQLADKSADLAAFFAITGEDDIRPFQTKLRGMFYEYARTGASFDGIRLVSDQDLETVDSLENCDFWQEAEPEIITTYGKIF